MWNYTRVWWQKKMWNCGGIFLDGTLNSGSELILHCCSLPWNVKKKKKKNQHLKSSFNKLGGAMLGKPVKLSGCIRTIFVQKVCVKFEYVSKRAIRWLVSLSHWLVSTHLDDFIMDESHRMNNNRYLYSAYCRSL